MVSLRLALPFAAAVLIGCGEGGSPSPADQLSRQAEAADTPSAASTPISDTAADGRPQASGLDPRRSPHAPLVEELKQDLTAAARAVVEIERTVRSCASIAIADPPELDNCKTHLDWETGVVKPIMALHEKWSRNEPNLSWIFLGRADAGECRRAGRSLQRTWSRHSGLLEVLQQEVASNWPSVAARNTKLTERHGEALHRLRSACRL